MVSRDIFLHPNTCQPRQNRKGKKPFRPPRHHDVIKPVMPISTGNCISWPHFPFLYLLCCHTHIPHRQMDCQRSMQSVDFTRINSTALKDAMCRKIRRASQIAETAWKRHGCTANILIWHGYIPLATLFLLCTEYISSRIWLR